MPTQHQMRNIGNGETEDIDAPLTYAVSYQLPHLVCRLKAYVPARSADAAKEWGIRMYGTQDVKTELL